jgi:hypothetical protein
MLHHFVRRPFGGFDMAVKATWTETRYHTIEKWDQLRSGMFTIITDAWWCTDEAGNPLFYSKHNNPQCNQSKAIAERLANGRPLRQIPVVYVPLRIQDYMD